MTYDDLTSRRDAAIHICPRCDNRIVNVCGLCAVLDARVAGAA